MAKKEEKIRTNEQIKKTIKEPKSKATTKKVKGKPKTYQREGIKAERVVRDVRKEIRLDDFTKGLLEKIVEADAQKGKSSTESSIIREAIHKYYVEKKNE